MSQIGLGITLREGTKIVQYEAGDRLARIRAGFIIDCVQASEGEMNVADVRTFSLRKSSSFDTPDLDQRISECVPLSLSGQHA
jgi:hypothetical protein